MLLLYHTAVIGPTLLCFQGQFYVLVTSFDTLFGPWLLRGCLSQTEFYYVMIRVPAKGGVEEVILTVWLPSNEILVL